MSRRWISPLYLRIEDIPEFKTLGSPERIKLSALASPLLASSGHRVAGADLEALVAILPPTGASAVIAESAPAPSSAPIPIGAAAVAKPRSSWRQLQEMRRFVTRMG